MQYEQPIPFYMAYPFLLPLDQEQAQEKDLQVIPAEQRRSRRRWIGSATGWSMMAA